MKTHRKLWKVVQTHKMGTQAPTSFVETEFVIVKSKSTKENKEVEELMALKKVNKLTRLSDFPDSWIITVEHQIERFWDSKRGKWLGWENPKRG